MPHQHWRTYGTEALPLPQQALGEPFRAFPSWFLRIKCERYGKVRMLNEAHATNAQRDMRLRDLLARARLRRPRGEGGAVDRRRGRFSSRPVRRIVPMAGVVTG